jgi:hypothetical protein
MFEMMSSTHFRRKDKNKSRGVKSGDQFGHNSIWFKKDLLPSLSVDSFVEEDWVNNFN